MNYEDAAASLAKKLAIDPVYQTLVKYYERYVNEANEWDERRSAFYNIARLAKLLAFDYEAEEQIIKTAIYHLNPAIPVG